MGNIFSSNLNIKGQGLKRKSSFIETEDNSSRKRLKLNTYTKNVYQKFFESGQGSDITIQAFDRKWKLHKMYLSESPYFCAMFNNAWLESWKNEISLHFDDKNITSEALHKIFSSFYVSDINIDPAECVSVLACSTFFQLDHVKSLCIDVMKDNMCIDNVKSFYEIADAYNCSDIHKSCSEWLFINIMLKFKSAKHLKSISIDLMYTLVSSPQFVAYQSEFCLYLFLKKWVVAHETFNLNEQMENDSVISSGAEDKYFTEYTKEGPYLLSLNGEKYQKVFKAMKLRYLIVSSTDLKILNEDNIIPTSWFEKELFHLWYQNLSIYEKKDLGPFKVCEYQFYKNCSRVSRLLSVPEKYSWRWTGYLFGFDLILGYNNRKCTLKLSRQGANIIPSLNEDKTVSKILKRNIMFQVCIYSLNELGQILLESNSGIESRAMYIGQEIEVLRLSPSATYPMLLSANFLLTSPFELCKKNSLDSSN